jgi:hypothetical protein
MTMHRRRSLVFVVALGTAGCSAGGPAGGDGRAGRATVAGAIAGAPWTAVSAAYWIGNTGAGSPPTIIFLLEAPTTCAAISTEGWDKALGEARVIEIGIKAAAAGTYQLVRDASVSYLRGDFNPDADSGTVTIGAVSARASISGSFDLRFAGDALEGTFDAAFCPQGVEP